VSAVLYCWQPMCRSSSLQHNQLQDSSAVASNILASNQGLMAALIIRTLRDAARLVHTTHHSALAPYQEEPGGGPCREAWERRMAHLRGLLQQRDSEVEELQRVLEEREEQLGEREGHILQQAELIRSQAAQMRELLQREQQQQYQQPQRPWSTGHRGEALMGASI
jgi:hypothetical protein